jgi:hypothetical protein
VSAASSGAAEPWSELVIEPLAADGARETASVLARAFETNPLHLALFGDPDRGALRRNGLFFDLLLRQLRGTALVAMRDDRIVGFAHWVRSP